MPSFSADLVTQIKAKIPLLDLARFQGIKLEKRGKDFFALCPFHDDKTPSLSINPQKQVFNCFGCEAKGSVIDWVMLWDKVSFSHAVEILRQQLPGQDEQTLMLDNQATDAELLDQVLTLYQRSLSQHRKALKYLDSRGLNDPELLKRFRLGFSDRSLGYHMGPLSQREGRRTRNRLKKLGVLRKSGHEHFWGHLVIPVFNVAGEISELYGRRIHDVKGSPSHLYLPGPHKGFFNTEALSLGKDLILCESLIDALTFWKHGFHNVTSAYGVTGLTDELVQALEKSEIERVFMAYDKDEAGDKAARKHAQRLSKAGLECLRVAFPEAMDANAFACRVSDPKSELSELLRLAKPITVQVKKDAVPAPVTEKPEIKADPEAHSSLAAIPKTPEPTDEDEEIRYQEPPAIVRPGQSQSQPGFDLPGSDWSVETQDALLRLTHGDRTYEVRGLKNQTSYEQLKVTLKVSRGKVLYADKLDLYVDRQRTHFLRRAATELQMETSVVARDLFTLIPVLEKIVDSQIKSTLRPEKTVIEMTEADREQALAFLRSPELLKEILSDFEACGLVGEETNKLIGYLCCVSRKLSRPLGVLIQSSSAAGKSSLLDSILNFIPEDDFKKFSALTGQSLFYMRNHLEHKVLAITEEEGAERASYAMKLLLSEGELSIASTGKEDTGDLETKDYTVKGPIALLLTTTSTETDEELKNRCLVLTVDEGQEQTQAIHDLQRLKESIEGLILEDTRQRIFRKHRNAQKLLKPVLVSNPFYEDLKFRSDLTRTRRDFPKYLTLIRTIAFLHQYQRPLKQKKSHGQVYEYIEVTLDDITWANQLAREVMGQSLDELSPQTRRLLKIICEFVYAACDEQRIERYDFRFSQRELRDFSGWSHYQVKRHLRELNDREYVRCHRGRRGQSWEYELLYDGLANDDQEKHFLGLADVEQLRSKWVHENPKWVHRNRGWVHEKGSREQVGANSMHPLKASKNKPLIKVGGSENVSQNSLQASPLKDSSLKPRSEGRNKHKGDISRAHCGDGEAA